LELKILSHTKNLSLVRDFISDAAQKFGFDEETTNKIVLATDEACTNIIKHAYHNADNKPIELTVGMKNNTFEVVIIDYGESFNPANIKPPKLPDYIKHYNKGGLGMYLMRSLVDKVEYKVDPGKKNLVRLVKHK
jgi:serine/threonine-protein kinase RsbW